MCPLPCLGLRHATPTRNPSVPPSPIGTGHAGDQVKDPVSARNVRRIECALFLGAVVAVTVGALIDTLWLLGIGAWALIGAGLIEMIYRP